MVKDKFDVRKIIIDITSLLYNQGNILRRLDMKPPPVHFMEELVIAKGLDPEDAEMIDNEM